jgi:hypothetical protein
LVPTQTGGRQPLSEPVPGEERGAWVGQARHVEGEEAPLAVEYWFSPLEERKKKAHNKGDKESTVSGRQQRTSKQHPARRMWS